MLNEWRTFKDDLGAGEKTYRARLKIDADPCLGPAAQVEAEFMVPLGTGATAGWRPVRRPATLEALHRLLTTS